ncbi:hypothetical protein KCP77_02270 [Salmonella enterica subsp. enterica]|nr:hypothetical protein KCP77_02270 [Salmonella enterica subsp. enterica]
MKFFVPSRIRPGMPLPPALRRLARVYCRAGIPGLWWRSGDGRRTAFPAAARAAVHAAHAGSHAGSR